MTVTDLTRKESEVLHCLSEGMRNQQIADQMGLSVNTVKTHLKNIYKKIGVDSRTAAIRHAILNKLN